MRLQILILAAGQGRNLVEGHSFPFYLAEMNGVTVLERIFASTAHISNSEHFFAFRSTEIERYRLDNVVKNISQDSTVVPIPDSTMGSACTALFVASQLEQAEALLIISANELVETNFEKVVEEFSRKFLTAGTIAFRSTHPRYSYIRLDKSGNVAEAAQQNPISNLATTGVFYFKTAGIFVNSAQSMILKGHNTEGNFYIAPVFNEIILEHGTVGMALIDSSHYKPLKTENHVQRYEQGMSA